MKVSINYLDHLNYILLPILLLLVIQEDAVIDQGSIGEGKRTRPVTVDLFIPRLRLAFEYQGKQHYQDIYGRKKEVQAHRGTTDCSCGGIWFDFCSSQID